MNARSELIGAKGSRAPLGTMPLTMADGSSRQTEAGVRKGFPSTASSQKEQVKVRQQYQPPP